VRHYRILFCIFLLGSIGAFPALAQQSNERRPVPKLTTDDVVRSTGSVEVRDESIVVDGWNKWSPPGSTLSILVPCEPAEVSSPIPDSLRALVKGFHGYNCIDKGVVTAVMTFSMDLPVSLKAFAEGFKSGMSTRQGVSNADFTVGDGENRVPIDGTCMDRGLELEVHGLIMRESEEIRLVMVTGTKSNAQAKSVYSRVLGSISQR